MDLTAIKSKIDREFTNATKKYDAMYRKVAFGKAKYRDLEKLADMSGNSMANIIVENLSTGAVLTEQEIIELVPYALRQNHDYLSLCIENVQRQVNKQAHVGLKPVIPAFDSDRAVGLAKEIAGMENVADSKKMLRQQVINNSLNIVDESVKKNARQHTMAGLKVTVIREYDGVGLHGGKDSCSWCLARAGTWDYADANENGVFERHPGCGCHISYVSEQGTQVQTDWASNTWAWVD